jgi:hypothetical protein
MRFLLFLPLLFCACSGGPSIPKDVIPPAKMEAILYDVVRADELVDFMQMTDSTFRPFSKRASFYDTIFQLHAVKKENVSKSLKYYQGRPDLLKIILDSLQNRASVTQKPQMSPLKK